VGQPPLRCLVPSQAPPCRCNSYICNTYTELNCFFWTTLSTNFLHLYYNKQGQLTQHCSHLLLIIVLLPATLLQIWIERWPQLLLTSSAAIDRYCLPAGPTAANPPRWRVMGECSDRPTDGQMVGHHTVT